MPRLPYLRIVSVWALLTAAALIAAVLTGVAPVGGIALAQSDAAAQKPTRHFRVEQPAGLSGADALTIYNRILDDIVAGYRLSNMPDVDEYRNWSRFNTVPYRSAQHGERFVNNYGNDAAVDYRFFESAGEMPAGAVLFKDSFAVTKRGDVFSGPLFVMKKMQPGFNLSSRDWRYTMIMPDGSLFGTTNGEGSDRVEFCVACHKLAGDQNDHLFYIPERYRVRFLN